MLTEALKTILRKDLHMSWASHNPEKYDQIIEQAISRKLLRALDAQYPHHTVTEDQALMCATVLCQSPVCKGLIEWAYQDIRTSEVEYWATLVDSQEKEA